MLECKDCCLYGTDACRYGRYALEHNMSLNCDDFIVEHNKAYQQGRADATNEIHTELITEIAMLNATKMTDTDLYAFAVRIKEITDK